jgi:hypothetical protein
VGLVGLVAGFVPLVDERLVLGARGLGVNITRSKLWVYIIAAAGTSSADRSATRNLTKYHEAQLRR